MGQAQDDSQQQPADKRMAHKKYAYLANRPGAATLPPKNNSSPDPSQAG